jgi:hypothetical protein
MGVGVRSRAFATQRSASRRHSPICREQHYAALVDVSGGAVRVGGRPSTWAAALSQKQYVGRAHFRAVRVARPFVAFIGHRPILGGRFHDNTPP